MFCITYDRGSRCSSAGTSGSSPGWPKPGKGGLMNTGLLVVRAVIGLVLVGHGVQKLFGWFGGSGLTGAGEAMGAVGFRPGTLFAFVAGATEAGGGLLLALGLLT